MLADDWVPDLLIFKKRGMEAQPNEQAEVAPPSPEPVLQQQKQEAVEQEAPKTESQPAKPSEKPAPEPEPVKTSSPDEIPKTSLSISESIRLAKGQFCINHQWRHAYAVCNICKLPYCYVDIMEKDGKLYCINDIESVKMSEGELSQPQIAVNGFSIMASVLFIANSLLLGYYTYPQWIFVGDAAAKAGLLAFVLHLSQSYYTPIINGAIVLFGLIAAAAIFRKSPLAVAFSLSISFAGMLAILYEYLNSNVTYLFVSTVLLLLSLAAIAYSRMSSVSELTEPNVLTPDIEWPKPEMY